VNQREDSDMPSPDTVVAKLSESMDEGDRKESWFPFGLRYWFLFGKERDEKAWDRQNEEDVEESS
jgi:hypothetical protein